VRALVVEDEELLRERVRIVLEQADFVVDCARDGREGAYYALEYPYDVAVVDLGLPLLDGMSLIEKVRRAGKSYPVLILTARDRWQDKVAGLDAGADDYLVKPFAMEELVARLRALIRRAAGWSHSVVECAPVRLDTRTQAVSVAGRAVELTGYEFQVLAYLMLHAGEVVSKTELTEHLYPDEDSRDSNVIEVFVRRLRLKLDPQERLHPIETLRGRGYRFALARSAPAA
jgi:two-component system, OmpR family, response regulator PhoP